VVLGGVGELVDGVDLVPAVLREVTPDELVDLAVERRRQQQPLSVGRRGGEQSVDRLVEAEVAQVVGLVEDGHLDGVEVALTTLDEVVQAARRGNDDVGTLAQCGDLLAHRSTAIDGGELEPQGGRDRRHRLGDLRGELTGGEHDEATRVSGPARAAGQPGEDGQAEGQRLAGAGAGTTEHVVAGQRVGNDRQLHGSGDGDLATTQDVDDRGVEGQVGEGARRDVANRVGHRTHRLGGSPEDPGRADCAPCRAAVNLRGSATFTISHAISRRPLDLHRRHVALVTPRSGGREELEGDAVRIAKAQARPVVGVHDPAVLDPEAVESVHPGREGGPVRAPEGNVIEPDSSFGEGFRGGGRVFVEPDQGVPDHEHGVVEAAIGGLVEYRVRSDEPLVPRSADLQ
jgi:hypothetical protein